MVLSLGTWAYNDLALAFYSAAAVYLFGFWLWRTDPAYHTPLLLAGVLAGLAMSLKYTSIITPLLLIGLLLWPYRHDWRSAWRPWLMFALPAGLVVAPWLIKNWLLTGNPVYPFLLAGQFWDSYRAAAYGETGTGIGLNPIAILRLPYDLTIGLQDASQDGLTGPLFLASLPLMLAYSASRLRHEVPPALKVLLLLALGYFLFWLLGVMSSHALWQSRLLLPAYILLCPAVAWIWADSRRFDHPEFSLRRFLHIALALVLILGLINQFLFWLGESPWAYLLGEQTRSANLLRRLGGHYEAMTWLNENLPDEAVVIFLWEPRSYFCDMDCRPDSILDRMGHLEYLYEDAEGIAAAWQDQGVTHLLVWRTAIDFILAQQAETGLYRVNQPLLTDLQEQYFTLVGEVGGYEVYEFR
jgi:hypothetical protein